MITKECFNIMELGALGDGKNDDTQAIQNVFDLTEEGGTIYFPAGRYLITKSIEVNNSYINIVGEGSNSCIIYTYEQKDSDTKATASLLVFKEGARNISIEDLKLEYTGYFYPENGQTYKGKVNALCFSQCFDINIKKVEISGFNSSAISIMTGDPAKYAKRFKVDNCYLHHNRVAGVLFGYVEQISITNCDLEYNGSVLDGATGYGCAGCSGELPRYIQMIGNRAMYNYRKGLDLHAGIEAIIEGNICHGNRLYGIYTEGRKTGNVVIRGNIISGMNRDRTGIPEPYTWMTGIDFGPYSKSLVPEEYHNYIIEGNQIIDFGLKEGNAYPISCYFNFKKGTVQIKNNTFRTGRIKHLVNFIPSASESLRDVKVDISGNQAFIEECTGYTLNLPYCNQIIIHGNQISTNQISLHDGVINLDVDGINSGKSNITYTNNHIEDLGIKASSALKVGLENEELNIPRVYKNGNFLNRNLEK